ncbi:MAG: collagen binding domain-containing protein, partial [Myxococcales bacterium]
MTLGTGQSTTSASTGAYTFTGLLPGTYAVTASAPNYTTESGSRTVAAGGKATLNLALTPKATAGVLRGAVFWGTDFDTHISDPARRLANATVKLNTGQTVKTDANGNYLFDLAPGTYTATASAAGYVPASVTRTVSSGATAWGSIMLAKETPPTTATVTGVVFWGDAMEEFAANKGDAGKRVAGATVSFSPGGKTAVTGSDGSFSLVLASGNYTANVSAPGYLAGSRNVAVTVGTGTTALELMVLRPQQQVDTAAPEIVVHEPADGAEVDQPDVVVRGTVADQSPIASFTLDGQEVSLTNGAFAVPVTLRPGGNELVLEAADEKGNAARVTLSVLFVTQPEIQTGIEGVVTDTDASGARLAGVTLTVDWDDRHAFTDDAGAFVLPLPPGNYLLTAWKEGYVPFEVDLVVTEEGMTPVEVALLRHDEHGGDEEVVTPDPEVPVDPEPPPGAIEEPTCGCGAQGPATPLVGLLLLMGWRLLP